MIIGFIDNKKKRLAQDNSWTNRVGYSVTTNTFSLSHVKDYDGKKLKGSFALVKTHGFLGKNAWLLIKHRDEYVIEGWDAKDFDFSEVSGRSLAEIS